MTFVALALVVAAALAVDALLEHGPEWAAWQRKREAARLAEGERVRADLAQIARRGEEWRACDWPPPLASLGRPRAPAAPAEPGRRRD